ncbi:MAG: hypothetical protein MJ137_08730, partial [Clostridia bacterium]|nr:hypothetical protein [Clostridia bacterium]
MTVFNSRPGLKKALAYISLSLAAVCLFNSCSGDNKNEESGTSFAEITSSEVYTVDQTTEEELTTEEITEAAEPGEALKEIILSGDRLKSKCTQALRIPAPGDGFYSQGGTTDGVYFYQAFVKKDTASNEANNIDRILKVELATGKVVAASGNLSLNHANDITVLADGNLAVVHNNPNRQTVSVIDSETLKLIKVVTVPYQIYCMNYQPDYDKFVVGQSGGQDFVYLNGSMGLGAGRDRVTKTATPLTKGYVTQGCSSDKNFIYFVLYKENVITVYDWDGKLATIIELDLGTIEPE